jgi:dTDP-glucose 4,6-dehydratase
LLGDYDYIIHLAPVPVDKVIACACRTNARVLFASSGAVYDMYPDEYARLKTQSENLLLASGLDVRIARMFSFVGWGLPDHLAPAVMVKSAMERQVIQASPAVRSYLDGSDMAEWLWAILLDAQPWTIYNVGSPNEVSMMELAHEIEKHVPAHIERTQVAGPRPRYVPCVDNIMQDLGVSIKVPWRDAVERYAKEMIR